MTTRARLVERGVHWKSIDERLRDGRLWEIWHPVLLVGIRPAEVTPDQVLAAAVLTVGPHGALDGASALERRGLWERHDGAIVVSSTRGHAPITFRQPRGWGSMRRWRRRGPNVEIRFVRRASSAHATTELIDGVRCRTALDALVRASAVLTPHQLAAIIKRGEVMGEFSIADVATLVKRHAGSRGIAALRRALELRRAGSVGTKSRSEDLLLSKVISIYGEPRVNVRGIAGIPSHEPDFCWPERRWIVEVDGGHHVDDPGQRESDLRNDDILRAAGWTVVRVPWKRVWTDMDGVLADLSSALRR